MLFTVIGRKFKFQVQDSFLEYFFLEIWRFEKHIALSEKKPPLTIVELLKELSNGRVIWLHLVVLSCTLISAVPASTTELPATLPCSHVREENLNVLEHVNASIKPVLMKNAFHSWCPMFCTYWLAIDDNDGS